MYLNCGTREDNHLTTTIRLIHPIVSLGSDSDVCLVTPRQMFGRICAPDR